ncbi:hypothetical protein [Sulfitobacter sabulilitoris]|uniref:Lipoprotein n=1 Tax=Sulfitobacter sabulilitoris TaxID=2562655 RepID=A0A5S3PKU3_9RHOB|nr:hypothetical protein [Sulfitobacter sabulilitoris]TMM54941.1 hypothetical protein FDT80_05020 [Sulfitobacter sabulilitoris]
MKRAVLISPLVLAACGPGVPTAEDFIPDYRGVETQLLDGDLVQFNVSMTKAQSAVDVERYAECAAAQYTLIRGYGFARHLRTNVSEEGGVWSADAVYTISPTLPRGSRTLDAEVVAADCAETGIPTV